MLLPRRPLSVRTPHTRETLARALYAYLTTVAGLAELSVVFALHSFYYLMKDVSLTQTYAICGTRRSPREEPRVSTPVLDEARLGPTGPGFSDFPAGIP